MRTRGKNTWRRGLEGSGVNMGYVVRVLMSTGLCGVFASSAVATDLTIEDVEINIDGVLTDIGDITVTVQSPGGGHATMEGTFTVDPAYDFLCDWIEFHWVQILVDDDCPIPWAGGGPPAIPPAFVDPPSGGWAGQWADAEPWYWDVTGPTNTGLHESEHTIICQTYDTEDTKTPCTPPPANWVLGFRTWLAGKTADNELCLIRGFEWARTAAAPGFAGPTNLGVPGAAHAQEVSTALTRGGIAGWTVNSKCDVTCEEPTVPIPTPAVSEWGLFALTLTLLTAITIKFGRRRKTA